MVARTRPATLDDLDATPDDGRIYELLNGEIVVSPAPLVRHQATLQVLNRLLDGWVVEHMLGDVYVAPTDVVMSDGNALQPDLFFISTDNPTADIEGRLHGIPDLAVEIMSPTSRSRDAVVKAMRFAREGVAEYWLVDPDVMTIAIFDLIDGLYRERDRNADDTLSSGVLAGLTINPVTIFAHVDQIVSRRRKRA